MAGRRTGCGDGPADSPVYVEEARGAHIRDIDGHNYVDFCLGDTGGMCGHAPEAVTQAALRQFARGTTTMLPTEDSLWVGASFPAVSAGNTGR